jgi:hypothetical protein
MEINKLKQRPDLGENTNLGKAYLQFETLLSEIIKKRLPGTIVFSINRDIDEINSILFPGNELRKQIKKRQARILKLIEKERKLVPKNYYRNLWLAVGMSAFGIPIGFALAESIGNMAFIGIGLPIGLAIGIAVVTSLDKKALKEGRQLDIEIKF